MKEITMEKMRVRKLGRTTETLTRVRNDDGTKVTADQLLELYTALQENAREQNKDVNIVVKVCSGNSFFSFSDPSDILNEYDYWQGKVKDVAKFTSYDFVDFYVYR